MKLIVAVIVAALAAAIIVVPEPQAPSAPPAAVPAPAPFAVCPLTESAGSESFVIAVGAQQAAEASVFSAGEIVARETLEVGTADAALEVAELSSLARSPVLVGVTDPAVAVESVLTSDGPAAATCGSGSPDPVVLAGGVTTEGESMELHIANPFAGTATVDVVGGSEVGTESEAGLTGLVVPPRSLLAVDLTAALPGRQHLSVVVTPTRGRVVVAMSQTGGGDVGAIQGLVPGTDWFLPVSPVEGMNTSLVLMAPGVSDVPVQFDTYSDEGVLEAGVEEVVPARGQLVVPVTDLLEGRGVIRVVAAAPVAAVTKITGEGARALIPGVSTPGASWWLPGAARLADAEVSIFNPGEVAVTAEVTAAVGGGSVETVEVPAAGSVTVDLPRRGTGARVEADGEVVVTWLSVTEAGIYGDSARPGR